MIGWCEYCLKTEHPRGCPNYNPPQPVSCCDICGEGIYKEEEYIENEEGKLSHLDCFCSAREVLTWLGHKVKTMEERYE